MKRIAIISAILEDPANTQELFNTEISHYHDIVKGRMGIPFAEEGIGVISVTVCGTLDEINALTGKLGEIPHALVKTAISKKEV